MEHDAISRSTKALRKLLKDPLFKVFLTKQFGSTEDANFFLNELRKEIEEDESKLAPRQSRTTPESPPRALFLFLTMKINS